MINTKLALCVVTALLFLMSCTPSTPPNVGNSAASANPNNRVAEVTPMPASAPVAQLTDGKEIFALNCMICHKDTGKGGKITLEGKTIDPDDLTTAKMKAMTDEKLIGYVTNGVVDEGMPAFKGKLTETEIKSVVAHVRTLQN